MRLGGGVGLNEEDVTVEDEGGSARMGGGLVPSTKPPTLCYFLIITYS